MPSPLKILNATSKSATKGTNLIAASLCDECPVGSSLQPIFTVFLVIKMHRDEIDSPRVKTLHPKLQSLRPMPHMCISV